MREGPDLIRAEIERWEREHPNLMRQESEPTNLDVLFGIISVVLIFGAYKSVPIVMPYLANYWVSIAVASLAIVLAKLLFWLRETRLAQYALLELVFGAVSVWFAADEIGTDPHAFVKLFASVYLIVRGLDNRKKAENEQAELFMKQYLLEREKDASKG